MTASISLGDTLEAFILEHKYCGDLDGGIESDSRLDDAHVRRGINRLADDD